MYISNSPINPFERIARLREQAEQLAWQQLLDKTHEAFAARAPRIFLSYAWQHPTEPTAIQIRNQQQVHNVAAWLNRAGVNALLDMNLNQAGTSISEFTHEILQCDVVVLCVSERLAMRYARREGVISDEIPQIIRRAQSGQTVLVWLQEGEGEQLIPRELHGLRRFDARDDANLHAQVYDLIRQLYAPMLLTPRGPPHLARLERDWQTQQGRYRAEFATLDSRQDTASLQRWEQQLQQQAQQQADVFAKRSLTVWQVPAPPRQELLRNDLVQQLQARCAPTLSQRYQRSVLIITGTVGSGKKTLLQQLWHKGNLPANFKAWFHAADETSLQQSYAQLGHTLGILPEGISPQQATQSVVYWLAHHPTWLLVYADAPAESWLQRYWPATGGQILVTSADSRWQQQAHYPLYLLPALSAQETLLWLTRLGKGQAAWQTLAQQINYHPGQLSEAMAYCQRYKWTPEQYYQRLQNGTLPELLHTRSGHDEAAAPASIPPLLRQATQGTLAPLAPNGLRLHENDAVHYWQREQLDKLLAQLAATLAAKAPRCLILSASESSRLSDWLSDLRLAGFKVTLQLVNAFQGYWADLFESYDWIVYHHDAAMHDYFQREYMFAGAIAGRVEQPRHASTDYQRDVVSVLLTPVSLAVPTVLQSVVYSDLSRDYGAGLLQLIGGIARSGHQASVQDVLKHVQQRWQSLQDSPASPRSLAPTQLQLWAQQQAQRRQPQNTTTRYWHVPAENPNFIERRAILQQVYQSLQSGAQGALALSAVQGMGGVGKSQLALYYAYHPARPYQRIFWLRAETVTSLETDYLDIGKEEFSLFDDSKTERDAKLQLVKSHFEHHPGWLLIADNADEGDWLNQYFPRQGGHVLITTRQPEWPGARLVDVSVMTPEEAQALYQRLSGRPENFVPLAQELGFLPLALAQAASYLNQHPQMSLAAYQAQYATLLTHGSDSRDPRQILTRTWAISIRQVRLLAPEAETVLYLSAFLAADDIPQDLLQSALATHLKRENLRQAQLETWLALLNAYSLIAIPASETVSIHRLVQVILRQSLSAEQASVLLQALFDSSNKDDSIERQVLAKETRQFRLLPHRKALLLHSDTPPLGVDNPAQAALINSIAYVYQYKQGEPRLAKPLYERALALQEAHYGKDHVQLAETLGNLGNAYGDLGEVQQQKALLERALALQEAHYGKDHVQLDNTLVNLSIAYGALGEVHQKKALLERALALQEAHYGKDHVQLAITLVNLGNAYYALGEVQKLKALLERALALQEAHYGKDHVQLAVILMNLGTAYSDLGEVQKQKALQERALALQEAHYGKDHWQLANTLVNLGIAYGDLGDVHQKKALLERALALEETHYGKDHWRLANTLVNLGIAYGDLGDVHQKKALLERALALEETHYGKDHWQLANTLGNLSIAYGALGEVHQKKTLLERARALQEAHYGKDHAQLADTLYNLGYAHKGLQKYAPAQACFQRALVIYQQSGRLNNAADAQNALDELAALSSASSKTASPQSSRASSPESSRASSSASSTPPITPRGIVVPSATTPPPPFTTAANRLSIARPQINTRAALAVVPRIRPVTSTPNTSAVPAQLASLQTTLSRPQASSPVTRLSPLSPPGQRGSAPAWQPVLLPSQSADASAITTTLTPLTSSRSAPSLARALQGLAKPPAWPTASKKL